MKAKRDSESLTLRLERERVAYELVRRRSSPTAAEICEYVLEGWKGYNKISPMVLLTGETPEARLGGGVYGDWYIKVWVRKSNGDRQPLTERELRFENYPATGNVLNPAAEIELLKMVRWVVSLKDNSSITLDPE